MAKGVAWLGLLHMSTRGVGLVSTLILARLLVPEDFGLVAMATMFVALLEAMSEFRFDLALIQNQEAGRRHYDTVWTMTVLRNGILAAVIVLIAPIAADFFEDDRLRAILYWLALSAFAVGFENVGVVNFRKELIFGREFKFLFLIRIGTFIMTVATAVIWRNYWALVVGLLADSIIRLVLSYLMHPYRPRFSLAVWGPIFHFSKWLVLNNILFFIYMKADTFFIGKMLGMQPLGLYRVAYEISNIPTTEIAHPIRQAVYPGFAKIGGRIDLLGKSFVDVLALLLMVGTPAAVGISLTADLIVPIGLGANWHEAIPLVRVLALAGLLNLWSGNSPTIFLTLDRTHYLPIIRATSGSNLSLGPWRYSVTYCFDSKVMGLKCLS